MGTRRFSVIINTDNRADSLAVTLRALAHLDHPNFEVIVVRGPTPDRTPEVLAAYGGRIKVGHCEHRNLSESRNIGVAMAAGEIVAFIDDDAYPDPGWLDELDAAYDDPEVAGAGGPVWDWTGSRLQVLYSIAYQLGDVWVENQSGVDLSRLLCRPRTPLFAYPIGTNASFLRNRVVEVGGFDEEFEYGWEDVDLCRRLIDGGWLVRVLETGYVQHNMLPNEVRDRNRVLHNLEVVLKNKAYYAFKHGSDVPLSEKALNLTAFAAHYREEIKGWVARGLVEPAEIDRYEAQVASGFDLGYAAFLAGVDRRRPPRWFAERQSPFLAFSTLRPRAEKLHLCFLSAEYPPAPVDGIGRVVHELATGLGHIGHEVHVLTRAEEDRVGFEDDVWVHRLTTRSHPLPEGLNAPKAQWDQAATARDEALRIHAGRALDLVQSPNWNSEGIAVLLDGRLELVIGLYTPLATVANIDSPLAARLAADDPDLAGLLGEEQLTYRRANHFLACGPAILSEIETAYGLTLDPSRCGTVNHGLSDWTGRVEPERWPGRVNVLFVGRLEDRKGIDTLLAAIPDVVSACPDVGFSIAGEDTRPMADGLTHRQRFELSPTWPAVADHVRFLGRVDDIERERLYAGCDVFVAPSRYESFGLILLDAMMAAKPVVACDVGGMAEIVADGETGFLVPVADPARLAAAICTLVSSSERRRDMGEAGRERYERLYRAETMVTAANRFYDTILGRRTADWRLDGSSGSEGPVASTAVAIPVAASRVPEVVAAPGAPESKPQLRNFPSGLPERLRCPSCRSPLEVVPWTLTVEGEVKTGRLRCPRDGTVGRVEQFKVDLVSTPSPGPRPAVPLVVPALGERRIRAADPTVTREGSWLEGTDGLLVSLGTVGDALVLEAECTDATVRLLRQPAGGIADVFVDGLPVASVDLFQPEGSQMVTVPVVEDLPLARRHLAVRARGQRHADSAGNTIAVAELVLSGPLGIDTPFARPEPLNRGNPYSPALDRWLGSVPEGEPVLEVGGGDRRRCRPGQLNMELLHFELPDLYGDIHAIPFADDSFAATWTQAVFEHVADPQAAADELIRVTRPGGLILTEAAFMQPLHAVPSHFFNATTWGLRHVFRSCEVLEADWFGDISFTVEWLLSAVGLTAKVDRAELAELLERLRSYDALVSHEELRPAASAVVLVARKPA